MKGNQASETSCRLIASGASVPPSLLTAGTMLGATTHRLPSVAGGLLLYSMFFGGLSSTQPLVTPCGKCVGCSPDSWTYEGSLVCLDVASEGKGGSDADRAKRAWLDAAAEPATAAVGRTAAVALPVSTHCIARAKQEESRLCEWLRAKAKVCLGCGRNHGGKGIFPNLCAMFPRPRRGEFPDASSVCQLDPGTRMRGVFESREVR
jgi:hypothetical protein